jgi:hypothetical protein
MNAAFRAVQEYAASCEFSEADKVGTSEQHERWPTVENSTLPWTSATLQTLELSEPSRHLGFREATKCLPK